MRQEESGGQELELIPHTSPREDMCAARISAKDGGAFLYVQPSGTANERVTGMGMAEAEAEERNYALTSATNCLLRSSSDGNPTSGTSVWGRVRRTTVQLADPLNRREPK